MAGISQPITLQAADIQKIQLQVHCIQGRMVSWSEERGSCDMFEKHSSDGTEQSLPILHRRTLTANRQPPRDGARQPASLAPLQDLATLVDDHSSFILHHPPAPLCLTFPPVR